MIQVASSFSAEPSLDVVLSSIPARIYEAVQFLQENMDTFTARVRRLTLSHHLLNVRQSIFFFFLLISGRMPACADVCSLAASELTPELFIRLSVEFHH